MGTFSPLNLLVASSLFVEHGTHREVARDMGEQGIALQSALHGLDAAVRGRINGYFFNFIPPRSLDGYEFY